MPPGGLSTETYRQSRSGPGCASHYRVRCGGPVLRCGMGRTTSRQPKTISHAGHPTPSHPQPYIPPTCPSLHLHCRVARLLSLPHTQQGHFFSLPAAVAGANGEKKGYPGRSLQATCSVQLFPKEKESKIICHSLQLKQDSGPERATSFKLKERS